MVWKGNHLKWWIQLVGERLWKKKSLRACAKWMWTLRTSIRADSGDPLRSTAIRWDPLLSDRTQTNDGTDKSDCILNRERLLRLVLLIRFRFKSLQPTICPDKKSHSSNGLLLGMFVTNLNKQLLWLLVLFCSSLNCLETVAHTIRTSSIRQVRD